MTNIDHHGILVLRNLTALIIMIFTVMV